MYAPMAMGIASHGMATAMATKPMTTVMKEIQCMLAFYASDPL